MRKYIRGILAAVFILIALGCGIYLVQYYMGIQKGERSAEKAKKEAVKERPEEEAAEIPIDFAALKSTNPDVYAWIRIPGTNIDYPIVQSQTDNEYYLNHTWDGVEAPQGAIFTQTYNQKDFGDYNTVVYGHRMSDANPTMFHALHSYMDPAFLKEHQEMTVYTEERELTYKVFAAVVYDDRLIPMAYNFGVESQRQEFLDSLYGATDLRNQYADNVEVTAKDKLLTLSTCLEGEDHHRFLVEAVLVDEK